MTHKDFSTIQRMLGFIEGAIFDLDKSVSCGILDAIEVIGAILEKEVERTEGLTMEELKPCPFCGGKARLLVNDGVRVICSKCYVGTMIMTDVMWQESNAVETVVAAWNRRIDNG